MITIEDFKWTTENIEQFDLRIDMGETARFSPYHQNQYGFRKPNLKFLHTDDEMMEFLKCERDIVYFAEKYCKFITYNGLSNIHLYDCQKEMLKNFTEYDNNIIVGSRQVGKSTMNVISMIHFALFNYNKTVLLGSTSLSISEKHMDMIRTIYRNLPFFLQPGIMQHNKRTLRFDNGCRIVVDSPHNRSFGIGYGVDFLVLDEAAYLSDKDFEKITTGVFPTIRCGEGRKITMSSTANGYNGFYQYFHGADDSNEFHAQSILWSDIPGRDEEWKQNEIANLGSLKYFEQEYENKFIVYK